MAQHDKFHLMSSFLLCGSCELPLDACWTACRAMKDDAPFKQLQAACSVARDSRCATLKINRTFVGPHAAPTVPCGICRALVIRWKGTPQSHPIYSQNLFLFLLVTSNMSHFFSQSCWVSYMLLLLWTWWKVSVPMAAIMAALLERCLTCLLYPPSHVCFSFLLASLSQPLWEIKCVFEVGVWVGLMQEFLRNSNELSHHSETFLSGAQKW